MKEKKHRRHRLLMTFTLIAATIYITWRLFFTLPLHSGIVSLIVGIALFLAEAIGVIEAIEHYLNMSSDVTPPLPVIPSEWFPNVDVLVATHNEDVSLLYKTINGCNHMQYPDKSKVHIYLCDDSNRPEVATLAEKMGVGYFGLKDNKSAKAGNLNNALHQTSAPLVVTFDADMIPTSGFLMETVPYFYLPRVEQAEDGTWVEREKPSEELIGFIQTPQSFYNPDLFQYNLYSEESIPNEQDYFFREVNVGRNRTNSPIYAGSNTVISRQALAEVGYIKEGNITEDFATGIEIQKKGYRCYAIDKTLAHGLAPVNIPSLIKQRERWGRGCVQTMRSISFFFSKMPLFTKLSYLSSFLYWWTFLRRFIYIVSPILYTVFGVRVVECSLWQLAIFWLPYYLLYNRTLRVISGNIRNQRWSNIVDTIIFPYMIIPVFLESVGFRQKKFIVTQKNRNLDAGSEFKYATPHIILGIATLIGLVFCLWDMVVNRSYASIILIFWLFVNIYFLLMAIFFMRGRVNFRREERLAAEIDTEILFDNGRTTITGITCDISEAGMAVVLDFPEYVPYDQTVRVRMHTALYTTELDGLLVHVAQAKNQWKYSIQIKNITEENRATYLQIVFDRQHTLPVIITSGLVTEVRSNLRSRQVLHQSSNRRLPRLELQQTLPTADGETVVIEDFNYEFVRLRTGADAPHSTITLLLSKHLTIECKPLPGTNKGLYRISNWEQLAANPDLHNVIESWRSATVSATPLTQPELSMADSI